MGSAVLKWFRHTDAKNIVTCSANCVFACVRKFSSHPFVYVFSFYAEVTCKMFLLLFINHNRIPVSSLYVNFFLLFITDRKQLTRSPISSQGKGSMDFIANKSVNDITFQK